MHKNISATTLTSYLSRRESYLLLTSHGLWGVEGGHSVSCQGDQQSCNAHVDPSLLPPLEAGSAHQAYCTGAQAPLDTHSALQMQKLPANISRHFTMYFTLSYCSVNWQRCELIVPIGLIQCAFGYQCHSFYFKQQFSLPFIKKSLMVILLHMFEHRPKIHPKPH